MNKEDFVTYKQALALKKLGFDYNCDYNYSEDKELYKYDYHSDFYSDTSSDSDLPAPTLAQAQKWLRKEKNLYVCVEIDITDTVNNIFYWTIYKLPYKKQIRKTRNFDSPEEALSAGITECLKLLENE